MTTLKQAHTQWANRPEDERFTSLTAMLAAMQAIRARSSSRVLPLNALRAAPIDDTGNKGLAIVGPGGAPTTPSHWAFSQICGHIEPARANLAALCREQPATLAADNVNFFLSRADFDDTAQVLLTRDESASSILLRAVTGPKYGRVHNASVISALIDRFGDGNTGQWRVPGEWGKRVEVTTANTTLFASDRDMWVFLADEDHRIEVPNRRDGKSGSLARGFFMWNSEVGKMSLGVATFLYDYVCGNRIVWGAEGYEEIRVRHTASAPSRFMSEIAPALKQMADSSTHSVVQAITAAKAARIGNAEAVDTFLAKRFTKGQVAGIKIAHMADENRPMETLWDVTTGVTAYARGIANTDTRISLEREGGAIMKLAA